MKNKNYVYLITEEDWDKFKKSLPKHIYEQLSWSEDYSKPLGKDFDGNIVIPLKDLEYRAETN